MILPRRTGFRMDNILECKPDPFYLVLHQLRHLQNEANRLIFVVGRFPEQRMRHTPRGRGSLACSKQGPSRPPPRFTRSSAAPELPAVSNTEYCGSNPALSLRSGEAKHCYTFTVGVRFATVLARIFHQNARKTMTNLGSQRLAGKQAWKAWFITTLYAFSRDLSARPARTACKPMHDIDFWPFERSERKSLREKCAFR